MSGQGNNSNGPGNNSYLSGPQTNLSIDNNTLPLLSEYLKNDPIRSLMNALLDGTPFEQYIGKHARALQDLSPRLIAVIKLLVQWEGLALETINDKPCLAIPGFGKILNIKVAVAYPQTQKRIDQTGIPSKIATQIKHVPQLEIATHEDTQKILDLIADHIGVSHQDWYEFFSSQLDKDHTWATCDTESDAGGILSALYLLVGDFDIVLRQEEKKPVFASGHMNGVYVSSQASPTTVSPLLIVRDEGDNSKNK